MALSGGGSLSIMRAVGQDAPNGNCNDVPSLRLSVPKPSWIVRTESNVRKMVRKKPDPPCVICNGRGTVDCTYCHGRGSQGCGGNGLGLCSRCLGTGEYRHIMGFNFMNMHSDQNHQDYFMKNYGTTRKDRS